VAKFKDKTTAAPKPATSRTPKKTRRLRVVLDQEDVPDYVPALRDVYFEASHKPYVNDESGQLTEGRWTMELCNLGMPCADLMDLIKWADAVGLHVKYEPAGNMAGWYNRKAAPETQYLFDVG
jgi:hypothetical protein